MVVVVPVPVIAPGLIVHFPVGGRPLSTTLPVGRTRGRLGYCACYRGSRIPGGEIMITSVEGREIHPASLVTLKL